MGRMWAAWARAAWARAEAPQPGVLDDLRGLIIIGAGHDHAAGGQTATGRHRRRLTIGLMRAAIAAAMVSCVLLFLLGGYILFEAVERRTRPRSSVPRSSHSPSSPSTVCQ